MPFGIVHGCRYAAVVPCSAASAFSFVSPGVPGVTGIYELGPFRLDAEAGVLTKAGVPVALGSRAVAVLTALVRRSGEYVHKGSIMDAAWPGIVVEESNLAVQISAIRRVLAQAPGGGKWIETLARRGY